MANLLSQLPLPKLSKQIALFVMVGGVCYFIVMALMVLFIEVMGMEVNMANVVASLIVMVINYFLNAFFVFERGRHQPWKEASAFFLFAGMGFGLNVVLMYLMTTFTPLHYTIIKTIVVFMVAGFNFVTRKLIVFKD